MVELVRLADIAMLAVRASQDASKRVGLAPKPGTVRDDARRTAVTISPDEWLLLGKDEEAGALAAPFAAARGVAMVDVSGNRIVYALQGAGAREMLARACAIDLDALVPGAAVSTVFARTQAIILCDGVENYRILPRRSFGAYIESWFDAARR